MKGTMSWWIGCLVVILGGLVQRVSLHAQDSEICLACHRVNAAALVMQWEESRHAERGVGCLDCHQTDASDPDAWVHVGFNVSPLVTPKDCAKCHLREYEEFTRSHHARAGEIIASLDNVLAEKAAGLPGNVADAVNGCWQCHGSIIKFERDASGAIRKEGPLGKLKLDADTWPNSGMGRINPDGSKGSCHACHSRHSFQAKLSRAPENCGKCHMGPDHPQIEIYNESKHGIAFYANRQEMALDKDGDWVLGRDYAAAPTCATCHISAYMTPDGATTANTHDVGERISWTLRPVVSTRMNLVIYEDGFKENFPETRALPPVGEVIETVESVARGESLAVEKRPRRVARIVTWQDRRDAMKGACANCHSSSFVDNFYEQFDDLVVLYNDKFARVAQELMNDLQADGALDPNAPFEHRVQWVFWELWHHEGRRARHGASMMGPDYTHWHGMYEVAKHFYLEFLPEVVNAAGERSRALRRKYQAKVDALLARDEHIWMKGLDPEEAARLREAYKGRYGQ